MAKLTASGRRLYLGATELRGHIGFNSFHPFETALITSGTTWQTAIDIAADAGAKVMRVTLAPRYKTDLEAYVHTYSAPNWTLRASYIAKVTEILDYAQTKGISLLAVPMWRIASAADITTTAVGTLADPTSAGREYLRQIYTQMLSNFNAHEALAGWCLFNEIDGSGYLGTVVWGTNVGKGTPASYSAPADVLTIDGVSSIVDEYGRQVSAAGGFWITGNAGAQVNASGHSWFTNIDTIYKSASALSWHEYLISDGCDRTPQSQGISGSLMTGTINKPLIIDEFGIQISGGAVDILNDADGSKIPFVYDGFRTTGVPLALEWQLAESADDSIYGIWSDNARGTQRLGRVAALNAENTAGFAPAFLPAQPPFDRVASMAGSATSYITVANATALIPSTFTVSAWVKPTLGTSSGAVRRVMSKVTASPAAGWYIGLDPLASNAGGAKETFFSLSTSNAGTLVAVTTQGASFYSGFGQWTHVAWSWDGTYLRTYINGVHYGALKTATYPFSQSTDSLYIGSDGGSLHFVGQMSDVQIFNTAIAHDDILDVIRGLDVPGCVAQWKLDGNALDSVGTNNGTAGAAVTYVAQSTARSTATRSVVSRSAATRGRRYRVLAIK